MAGAVSAAANLEQQQAAGDMGQPRRRVPRLRVGVENGGVRLETGWIPRAF